MRVYTAAVVGTAVPRERYWRSKRCRGCYFTQQGIITIHGAHQLGSLFFLHGATCFGSLGPAHSAVLPVECHVVVFHGRVPA